VYDKSTGVGKALIDFTEEARREISDRQWRYFSPRLADVYTRTDTGEKVKNVILKGSLTNTPVFKGLEAIEFSEGEVQVVLDPPKEPEATPEVSDEKEGDKVDEAKLREIVGIGEGDDLEAALKKIVGENKNFAELNARAAKVKNFAEDYPEIWAEHLENKKKLRKAEAKNFAESYLNPTEDSKMVMPPSAREALEEAYMEFAEGTASVDTLESIMDAARKGFVEMGERGGSDNDEPKGEDREALIAEFAEKMGEHMAAGKDQNEAYLAAKEDCPKGWDAYTSQEIPAFVATEE